MKNLHHIRLHDVPHEVSAELFFGCNIIIQHKPCLDYSISSLRLHHALFQPFYHTEKVGWK